MTSVSRVCAFVALLGCSFPLNAADYYVAETGRTARTEVNTSAAMGLAEDSAAAAAHGMHVPGDGADLGTPGAPAVEVSLKQMVQPEVEKAVVASGIDRIGVQSEGVETSLRTFAEIQVNAITGKSKFEGHDPVYLLLGMVYQNMSWARVPMIPVENAELAKAFGLDPKTHNRVSSVWVMKNPEVRMMVMSQLSGMEMGKSKLSEDGQKALKKFAFRLGSFLNLPGELKLVPMKGQPAIWLAPLNIERPELLADNDPELARDVAGIDRNAEPYKSLMALDAAIKNAYNAEETAALAGATKAFVEQADSTAGYMTPLKRQMDYIQTTVHPFGLAARLFMGAFFAFLVFLALIRKKIKEAGTGSDGDSGGKLVDGRQEEYGSLNRTAPAEAPLAQALQSLQPGQLAMAGAGPDAGFASPGFAHGGAFDNTGESNYGDPISTAISEVPRGSRFFWGLAFVFMLIATLTLVFALANRAYLGGRMPVSNMYESITFAMGAFAIVSLVFEAIYRRGWIGVGASFAGWFLMMMANSMSLQARKVEPLVAVLNSVWLNFHVTSLLISYSCFLLAFVASVLFLIKDATGNRPGMLPRAETFEYLTYRAVQIGWPLLTLGIFLGAVWANTAWGSFWSWDPKETWALITWLTYTVYLHLRINLGWNGHKSVIASMFGFIMVIVTYFGVSYLPGLAGGMHSYAEPIKR